LLLSSSKDWEFGTAGEIVTVGPVFDEANVVAVVIGDTVVVGVDSFSFIPAFSKIVVDVTGVVGDETRSKFSSTSFPDSFGDEMMFFSFIRLKILTFSRPVLAAVVTEIIRNFDVIHEVKSAKGLGLQPVIAYVELKSRHARLANLLSGQSFVL